MPRKGWVLLESGIGFESTLGDWRGLGEAALLVHLSHGQFLNRFQLRHIMEQMSGPAAIIGDFNAVGPVGFQGFSDIGPRRRTHRAGNIIALRLDRCIARWLECSASEVLDKGPSDHHPMVLDMKVDPAFMTPPMEEMGLIGVTI